jgi:hypothetical protein
MPQAASGKLSRTHNWKAAFLKEKLFAARYSLLAIRHSLLAARCSKIINTKKIANPD